MDEKPKRADILVVDDRPDHLKFVTGILTDEGYGVRAVESGELALKEVEKVAPDLILLDVAMPGMDGYEVCRRLKNDDRFAKIPVIFVSASNDAKGKIKALETGGVDYVSKPFIAKELCARIKTHLDLYWTSQALDQQNLELEHQNALIKLVRQTVSDTNDAADFAEGAGVCLRNICAHTGWPVGHVYLISTDDDDLLVPSRIWHLKDKRSFSAIVEASEQTTFKKGVGLPGRVLKTGEPEWIVDVTVAPDFPRAEMVDDIGVRGAFAVPVRVGPKVVAVLEFFDKKPIEPDNSLFQSVTAIGSQLGRLYERAKAAKGLREARDAVQEAIISSASPSQVEPFPTKLVGVAALTTLAVLVWFSWFVYDTYQFVEDTSTRIVGLERARGDILHFDEVLTMSASMAAATGEVAWIDRYRIFEPKLDTAIKQAIDIARQPDIANALRETDAANVELVRMENQVFELVRERRLEEAQAILSGKAYADQKQVYTGGMEKLLRGLRAEGEAAVESQRTATLGSILAMAAVTAVIIVACLVVIGRVRKWRAAMSKSVKDLIRVEEALRKSHDELEQMVAERTRELQEEIGERKRTEEELAVAKEDAQQKSVFLRGIIDNIHQGISVFDKDLHLITWNIQFEEMMDIPSGLLTENVHVRELYLFNAKRGEYGEGDPEKIADKILEDVRQNKTQKDHQWERVRPNGMVIEVIGKIMSDGSILSTHTDITEQRRKEEKTKRQAMKDALTGLANRRAFEAEILEAMKEADQSAAGIILAMVDLDNFKEVNDRHGHATGDAMLRFFASLLREQIRASDFAARLGGDEFAIVFRNTDKLSMVEARVKQIIEKTAAKKTIDGCEINIGASVGISRYPVNGTDLPALMESADAALYKAKGAGKGSLVVAG